MIPSPTGKAGAPSLLDDPDVLSAILESIREGCFPHVAAQAEGVMYSTWRRWMIMGEVLAECLEDGADFEVKFRERYPSDHMIVKSRREQLLGFFLEVRKAEASIRRRAERAVVQTEPYKWLMHGPGRDRPNNPGWTNQTQIVGAGAEGQVQLGVQVEDYRQAASPLKPPEAEE